MPGSPAATLSTPSSPSWARSLPWAERHNVESLASTQSEFPAYAEELQKLIAHKEASNPSSPSTLPPSTPPSRARGLQELIAEQEALRPSSPWQKGDLQGLAWEQGVKWELGTLNLLKHPIFLRARDKNAKGGLLRARSTGRLGDLREALREGRSQLGLENPQVKRAGRLLRETDSCSRKCLELSCAEDSGLAALSQTMEQLGLVVPRAKYLGSSLGSGFWQDPALAWGLETLNAWQSHQPALQDLMFKAQEGAQAYCEGWVELALGQTDIVEAGLGTVATRELLQTPGAGSALAGALARRWEGPLPPAPSDGHGIRALEVARVRNLLSELDVRQLDSLLLAPGPDLRLGVEAAVGFPEGTAVFCPLYQALCGEGLLISKELQSQLERARLLPGRLEPPLSPEAAERPGPLALRLKAARQRLGELLGVEPRHFCLRRVPPNSGLRVRLFPSVGQPSATEAARLLGPGASPEVTDGRGDVSLREMKKWRAAGSVSSEYYHLLCATSSASAEAQAATGREVPLEAAYGEAKEAFEAVYAEAAEAGSAWEDAKRSVVDFKKLARQYESEAQKWLYSNVDDADEKVEECEEKQAKATAKWEEAKAVEKKTEAAAADAFARRDAARGVLDERTAKLEAAKATTQALEKKVADLAAKCQDLLHTPLVPKGSGLPDQPVLT